MAMGKIKRVFPGNNTSRGFYSFYDYPGNYGKSGVDRMFILKGGPGVGKSTLIKKVGMALCEKGYDIKYYCCSSDNNSMDGVVVLGLGVAIIDGTAPHVVDPKSPGAVDEIINLGEHWNEKNLVEARAKIEDCKKDISRMYQITYSYLKEAQVAGDELESYFKESLDIGKVNNLIFDTYNNVFKNVEPQFGKRPLISRFFASANTPGGFVNHLDTILQDIRNLYLLNGEPGTGKDEFLKAIFDMGTGIGLDCEVYHCPFKPELTELLCFPELNVAFLRMNEPLQFDPAIVLSIEKCEELNFNTFIREDVVYIYEKEIINAKSRIALLREMAWDKIKTAKIIHDEMEKYYIPGMDFEAINNRGEELLKKILLLEKK